MNVKRVLLSGLLVSRCHATIYVIFTVYMICKINGKSRNEELSLSGPLKDTETSLHVVVALLKNQFNARSSETRPLRGGQDTEGTRQR